MILSINNLSRSTIQNVKHQHEHLALLTGILLTAIGQTGELKKQYYDMKCRSGTEISKIQLENCVFYAKIKINQYRTLIWDCGICLDQSGQRAASWYKYSVWWKSIYNKGSVFRSVCQLGQCLLLFGFYAFKPLGLLSSQQMADLI